MVPLPVQAEFGIVKVITIHDGGLWFAVLQRTHCIGHLAVLIAQHRPAIDPTTGHQGEHTTHTPAILEDDTIPVTVLCINDGALGFVGETTELAFENHLLLPRTVDIVGTITHLTAMTTWGIHV